MGRVDIQPVRGKYADERERWPEGVVNWAHVERYRAGLYDWEVDGRRLHVAPDELLHADEAIVRWSGANGVARCLPLNYVGGPLLTSLFWPFVEGPR